MKDVHVPDIKITMAVAGELVFHMDFRNTHRAPAAWEITGAIYDRDTKSAVRACLLACLAELSADVWEDYTFEAESGSPEDVQPLLPWRE